MCLFGCHQKFCNSQAGLRDQCPQRTTRDLSVIRNREGGENAGPRQYNVTATLTRDLPTQSVRTREQPLAVESAGAWASDEYFDFTRGNGRWHAEFRPNR